MRVLRSLCVVTLVWSVAGALNAEAQSGIFVSGAGIISCGKFLETRDISRRSGTPSFDSVAHAEWLAGFLSGANWQGKGYINAGMGASDIEGRMAWIEKSCRENHSILCFCGEPFTPRFSEKKRKITETRWARGRTPGC